MFKCYDNVVGEIVQALDKATLLQAINERFVDYNNHVKSDGTRMRVSCYCIKGVYYIVKM